MPEGTGEMSESDKRVETTNDGSDGGMLDDKATRQETLDAKKLQAELVEVREALKKANAEAAERRFKLQEYEEADKKRRTAEMSDLEKAQTELGEMRAQYDKLVAEHDSLRLRQAFFDAVGAEKLEFASPQAMQDAYELVDLADVFDDGKIDAKAIKTTLEALQKSRPYLFGKAVAPETDAGKRGAGTVEATDDEVNEFAAVFGLDPKHVDRTLLGKSRR